MAIYHMQTKVLSRSKGRSFAAAAAYISCDKVYNCYDGIEHDYLRKKGCIFSEILLPKYANTEWKDTQTLAYAIESAEKSKDSRLAREIIVALPIELGLEEWKKLAKEYIEKNFVKQGMAVLYAIHDTGNGNPHIHILATVRPLQEDGSWSPKTQKEYLCVKDGEEKGFTAKEFAAARLQGWEKQYSYQVGRKKFILRKKKP